MFCALTRTLSLRAVLLSILLSGCSVLNVPRTDERLTPQAEKLLSERGLEISHVYPKSWRFPIFDETLKQYRRIGAGVQVKYHSDCRGVAGFALAILTLGIFPAWCPESVSVCVIASQGECEYRTVRYWDEYLGWLVGPLAILPGWKSSPPDDMRSEEMDYLSNHSIIRLLNEIAADR
jgi:hypothetical protein